MTEVQAAVERLISQHGGLRKAARAVGMQPPYMCKLRYDTTLRPSAAVLRKLGLKAVTVYRPVSTAM